MVMAIEILHTFAPDEDRRQKAKVWDCSIEHLTAAERNDVAAICAAIETAGHGCTVRSMQHVGPVGDALDLLATIASAGEALCQFVLNRALINPLELAAAKTGIAECWLTVSDMLPKFESDELRKTMAALAHANEFLDWAPDRFVPLFTDLEAHARKKFPHLAADDNPKEGVHV
jgi:hypothetical protein